MKYLKRIILASVFMGICSLALSQQAIQVNPASPSLTSSDQSGESNPNTPPAVWTAIAKNNTPNQLFEKIMVLANKGWVTPVEVAATFEIKFKPPLRESERGGEIYIAEGSTFRDGGDFELFHNDNPKGWTLILQGFSNDLKERYGECIRYKFARERILDLGWSENNIGFEAIEIRYDKKTKEMWSWLRIGSSSEGNENRCLNYIQFTNAPAPQTANKKN